MFGFKSKKDKRIEYLENRIRELENAFYQPKIFQKNYHVETISAMDVVEPGVPIDFVKGKIAGKILDDIKDRGLYFEALDDNYRAGGLVLRGTLHFISNETLSRK